jgi:hypothetical protein
MDIDGRRWYPMTLPLSASGTARRTPARARSSVSVGRGFEAKRLALTVRDGFLDHFVMKFDDRLPKHLQNGGAAGGEVVVPTAAFGLAHGGFRAQPPVSLQAFQQGIEGAGTDIVAMPSQLTQHPLTDDRMLAAW